MAIRIGIMGYGNLGRGSEAAITRNPDMEHTALISCGWDPGLFSLARLYSHFFFLK